MTPTPEELARRAAIVAAAPPLSPAQQRIIARVLAGPPAAQAA